MIAAQQGLIFHLIQVTDAEFQIGSVTLTCSSMAISSMTNIIIFWSRHVATAIWNPSSLTVIKSHVRSEKVSKLE